MKSSIIVKLFTTLAVIFSAFASPLNLNNEQTEKTITYKEAKDVNYYKDLTLDIYYNERNYSQHKKLPVIIFIHGGFWMSGDKSYYSKGGELFQKEGYVAVIPKYTVLSNDQSITIDDMVDEIYHAIKWTFVNIKKYGGDPLKITLSGHSAGAHLAALTLIKSDYGIENNGELMKKLPKLKHVLLLNGPYTLDLDSAVQQLNAANLSSMALGLTKLFSNAENVFPLNILATMTNQIPTLSAKQVTVLDTEGDLLIPSDVSKAFVSQIQRTTIKSSVDYILLEDSEDAIKPDEYGGHSRIIVDLYNGHTQTDIEAKTLLLNIIKKYNKTCL